MAIGTFTDLNVTEDYAADTKLTEVQLNTAMTSIETFSNTTLARNLEQLAKDCFGDANYTFDSDGAANNTNTLFDKQSSVGFYNGGSLPLGTSVDGAYGNVDAVNAKVTITPEVAGKYEVTFTFNHTANFTATTEGQCETTFRITDGTDASYAVRSGVYMPAPAANSGRFVHPVSITHIFTWDTTLKTITLQKFNRIATAVDANVVAATADAGELYMKVVKI